MLPRGHSAGECKYSSLEFHSAGEVVGYRRSGGGQAEAEAGGGVATEAPRVLHQDGHQASAGHPDVWAARLLQDHDS